MQHFWVSPLYNPTPARWVFNTDPSLHLLDPSQYITHFKSVMSKLKAVPVRKQTPRDIYIRDDLSSCTHVYVRHDGVQKPLQPLYDGPFKVIKRNSKYFTLNIGNGHDTISLDRLKPAYLDTTFTSEL